MSNQKTNPKVEWGFYATVPRIVRTDPRYKDISHAAKWLYTCLKDLCGNHGSCFRALRTLSEETGISTGSLSTMIRELHDVGLIHAEKKSRGKGGKEVWHISVVDIWQANREYCSIFEQLSDGDVQILNNALPVVQNLNDVVQNLNSPTPSCSENERSCSNFDDRRTPIEEQRYEEITREEERAASPHVDAPHAHTFEHESDNHSYRHDHTRKQDAWNCENWRSAHDGTCEDYQAYIERGGRDEPTDKFPVVKIGATDGPAMATSGIYDPRGNSSADPGHISTDQRTQAQVAIASTPGEAAAPPTAIVPQSVQGPDGAAAERSSGPRASRKRKPPQLTEREKQMIAWLEELRGIELDLSRRDVTAIRSLSAKKGTDDKETFLNVVAVLDIDPWFEEHKVGVDFYWIDRQWENKYMFLQRKKPKAALDDSARYPSFDDYVGNGPEERKRWREKSAEMKALGFSPDL